MIEHLVIFGHFSVIAVFNWPNGKYFVKFIVYNPIYILFTTPPLGQDMTQGQFFKRSLTVLNSEFSFS